MNWTPEHEQAFKEFLAKYRKAKLPVPKLLVKPFRDSFRKRGWSPSQIREHEGLLPTR